MGVLQTEGCVGLSISIMADDSVIYSKGFGYADYDRHILTSPDTRYRIASISKHVSTMAIMTLYDDG